MAEKIVTIAQYESYIEAEMAKQTLEDEGIKVVITGANTANVYSVPAVANITLQVLESQAEQARQILEDIAASPDENERDADEL